MELTEKNLNGKIYNRWKIIKFSHKVGYHKYFICECLDCNKKKPVAIQNIIRGVSKSCGCKSKIETAYNINKKYNKYEIDNDVVYVNLNNSDENIMIRGGYATSRKNHKTIIFHRIIMGTNDSKIQVDHINGNTLDNRKQNLRICSNQENSFNKNKNSNNSSGYKGVYFDKERNKWRSAIQFNGKSIKSPKRYDTPEEAYEWYVQKSNELFGDFSVFKSRK